MSAGIRLRTVVLKFEKCDEQCEFLAEREHIDIMEFGILLVIQPQLANTLKYSGPLSQLQ